MKMTINDIAVILGCIAGIITSLGVILVPIRKSLTKAIKDEIEPISKEINNINGNVKELDIGQCKNFLVRFLADVEHGKELDQVEKERAYELYDRYTNQLNQNSYIHSRWQTLMEKDK